jgi:two-component system NarL family response regulator
MAESDPIRILIADDHTIVREGLAALLGMQEDMTVVAQAANGKEAVGLYRDCRPDVVLMDLRMPETDGVAAIDAIREEFPAARFIVLTTYDGDADIYRGLRAGAQGYLLKDVPHATMLSAIRAVHGGRMHIPPEVAGKLAQYVSRTPLTEREIDVRRLVADVKSIQVVGEALFITESTIKTHVNSILTKLGASDRTQAVTLAVRRGILQLD